LKQLHAKYDTLAWYYGLDALRYFNEFQKTYLCLKTISFVHILNFDRASSYLFFWKLRLSRASFGMHKRVRLQDYLEEIVSLTSDSSVVMSSPLTSARDF
jgi:hypothetical protein